jgi:glucose dehydrogenase
MIAPGCPYTIHPLVSDRGFSAFDEATGKKLWHTRLTDVPNSNAISYAVNGKQYIAVVAGNGGNHACSCG